MSVPAQTTNEESFTKSEQKLMKKLVSSNSRLTREDVIKLIEVGALTTEDGKEVYDATPIVPQAAEIGNMKLCSHKKALFALAREKGDPDADTLMQLHNEIKSVYERLEQKYGMEASTNQGSLIGKVMRKIRNTTNQGAAKLTEKLNDFVA
jgi:hypothetical protein